MIKKLLIIFSLFITLTLVGCTSGLEITSGGDYVIQGNINKTIVVDAKDEDVTLILDSASIHVKFGPAIYVKSANSVTILLQDGTNSTIKSSFEYDSKYKDNGIDAAIFSECNLYILGNGKLNVIGEYKHSIASNDNINIKSSELSLESTNNSIYAKNFVVIDSSSLSIDAQTNGIKSKNDNISIINSSVSINAKEKALDGKDISVYDSILSTNSVDDCFNAKNKVLIKSSKLDLITDDDAIHSDKDILIENGEINIVSHEGIEGNNIVINNGKISITSSEDGINATNLEDKSNTPKLTINGGEITIDSMCDGIDSNGDIEINDGLILINGPTIGDDSPLDYDGIATINGGTFVAVGSKAKAQNFTYAAQPSILYKLTEKTNKPFAIVKDGVIIQIFRPIREYDSFLVSTSSMKPNESYDIYIDIENTDPALNQKVKGGKLLSSFKTIENILTGSNLIK